MRALPALNHSQKGTVSDDQNPGLSIRVAPPARRRVSPLAILLPVNRGTRQFIRGLSRANGCRPHTFAHQLPVKLFAAALVHHRRLSNCGSSAGSTNASNRCQKIGKVCQNGGSRD